MNSHTSLIFTHLRFFASFLRTADLTGEGFAGPPNLMLVSNSAVGAAVAATSFGFLSLADRPM